MAPESLGALWDLRPHVGLMSTVGQLTCSWVCTFCIGCGAAAQFCVWILLASIIPSTPETACLLTDCTPAPYIFDSCDVVVLQLSGWECTWYPAWVVTATFTLPCSPWASQPPLFAEHLDFWTSPIPTGAGENSRSNGILLSMLHLRVFSEVASSGWFWADLKEANTLLSVPPQTI